MCAPIPPRLAHQPAAERAPKHSDPSHAVTGEGGASGSPSGAEIGRIEDVTQRYGKATALDGVTLALPAGCMVGLIGPDGVGKSSLLAIIAGARQIQTGKA